VAIVGGATRVGDTILTVGLPLWVVRHTHAPPQLAAWLITINTILVILLQTRVSRGAETTRGGTAMQRRALLALATACGVAAVSHLLSTWAAVAALALSVLFLTFGELLGESARWSFRYGFAPAEAQGTYGGVFNIGTGGLTFVAPVMVAALTDRLLGFGWLILAGFFLLALVISVPVNQWAERTRSA
jgi:hypothetical protein